MTNVPAPSAADDVLDSAELRTPPQNLLCLAGRRDQPRRIAGTPRLLHHWNVFPGHFLTSINHFEYRDTASDTEVEKIAFFHLQSECMRLGQVGHMDVVSDTTPVGGRIIPSEYLGVFTFP